jgi:hypothetical protein
VVASKEKQHQHYTMSERASLRHQHHHHHHHYHYSIIQAIVITIPPQDENPLFDHFSKYAALFQHHGYPD